MARVTSVEREYIILCQRVTRQVASVHGFVTVAESNRLRELEEEIGPVRARQLSRRADRELGLL